MEITFINVNFPYKRKTYALVLELFLCLLVLNGLWLKIIHRPKRRIPGWHVLVFFRVKAGHLEQECFMGKGAANTKPGLRCPVPACWRYGKEVRGLEGREGG